MVCVARINKAHARVPVQQDHWLETFQPGVGHKFYRQREQKQANCYLGISYGKVVVMCKPYIARLHAERYCKFIISRINDGIQNSSSPRAKHILQDNCPVMNATFVVDALTDIETMRFKIF